MSLRSRRDGDLGVTAVADLLGAAQMANSERAAGLELNDDEHTDRFSPIWPAARCSGTQPRCVRPPAVRAPRGHGQGQLVHRRCHGTLRGQCPGALRALERSQDWETMNVVENTTDDGPVFLKANQKGGSVRIRIEHGLGEGILISGHGDDDSTPSTTWGPLPLNFF